MAALEDAKAAVNAAGERNLRAALDLAAKRAAKPETLNVLALYDGDDLAGISGELRKLTPGGAGEFAQRVLIAGRYGRVQAQMLNFGSNLLNAVYEESLVSATAQVIAQAPGGAGRIAGVRAFAPKGEVARTWMGIGGALPDATRFLTGTFWDGSSPEAALRLGVADLQSLVGQGLDTPTTYFKVAGREFDISGPKWLPLDATLRALYGSDGFFRGLLNNGRATSRSMREGDNMVQSFVEAERRVRDAVRERGLVSTFNRPYGEAVGEDVLGQLANVFDRPLQGMGASINGFAPFRVLIPAARFGLRWTQEGMTAAGPGLLTGTLRARAARNIPDEFGRVSEVRAAAREQAMGALGAAQLAIGSLLVQAGVVTGPLPNSESERLNWQRLGKQPMALKVGDVYVPLGWFGPAAAGLALSAMLIPSADEDDLTVSDRVGRAAMGFGQWWIDQPGIWATRQLLDGVVNAMQYGSWAGLERSAANAFKPGAATQSFAESWTAVFDKYQRDPEGFIQLLIAKAPGASMTLPPKIDPATGKPLERAVHGPAALFQSEFEGASRARVLTDPVERAIVEVGAGISSMDRNVTSGALSVRLTQDEYVRLSQRAGALGKEVMEILLKTPEYQQADVRARQSMITTIYDRARQEARRELAVSLLTNAQKPEDVQRALVVARATLEQDQFANVVRLLHGKGMLTEQVMRTLDRSRPSFRSPTMKEITGRSGP